MGLPFGIIHHSIRFPTWMPEKISGLRAKRMQRQPGKGFVFAFFFHARNHITFCWAILLAGAFACSGKSFHAVRYIPSPVAATSIRLPFGIIHHSIRLSNLDAGKNLRVTGKKNATTT